MLPATKILRRAALASVVAAVAAAPASAASHSYLDRPAESRPDGGLVTANPDPVPVVRSDDGGYDWSDAAIGAGAGVAVLLVGAGGAAALAHRRRAGEGQYRVAS